ncbi:MAG: methyltransferase domain-containing protein, partial [Pseudomonadota bacterium]
MNDNTIFDRNILRLTRNRRAGNWQDYNWLKQEAARRLVDTLFDIKQNFPLALDLGCNKGELGQIMLASGKVGQVISCDLAEEMNPQIVCDEEFLPFADNCFDLVTSCLALHNVNDLVGSLVQIRSSLKPGGFFIATIYGVNTLKELRESAVDAACLLDFPLSPRVAPFVDIRDAGALLQRSGFALPVASS